MVTRGPRVTLAVHDFCFLLVRKSARIHCGGYRVGASGEAVGKVHAPGEGASCTLLPEERVGGITRQVSRRLEHDFVGKSGSAERTEVRLQGRMRASFCGWVMR